MILFLNTFSFKFLYLNFKTIVILDNSYILKNFNYNLKYKF